MKLKDFIDKTLVGHYVNRIKKRRELDNHCALSLLLDVVLGEQGKLLPPNTNSAFWVVFVPELIQSFELRHDWNDVLVLCF